MIRVSKLNKTYQKPGEPPVHALQDVALQIDAGECVAVLGPSGSGKSTLMNMLGLLDRPDSGTYLLKQQDVGRLDDNALARLRNRTIGFVFQAFHLLPRTTALENVQLPLLYADCKDPEQRSLAALEAVGLGNRRSHYPHELSGGQQQRVAIARALVTEPDLILADEPTGNLDTGTQREIMQLFRSINAAGRTVVFITHSAEVAATADRIIKLHDGRLVSDSGAAIKHREEVKA